MAQKSGHKLADDEEVEATMILDDIVTAFSRSLFAREKPRPVRAGAQFSKEG